LPIAHCFGAGDEKRLQIYFVNSVYLSAFFGIALSIGAALLSGVILQMMQTPANIFKYAYEYLAIIFAGIFVTIFYNLFANVSRALGDSKTPLYFLVVGFFCNIVFDLLFILVFNGGTAGAALATVFSQFVSAAACLIYMIKKFPVLRVPKKLWRFDFFTSVQLLKMGMPMALQFSITAIGGIILQSTINPFGSNMVAAITAASQVQMILTQPMEALSATIATYSSQNLGAKRLDRIKHGVKSALLMTSVFSILSYIISRVFGGTIATLFISAQEIEIMARIKEYLLYCGLFFIPLGTLLILRSTVQGLGYSLSAMFAGIFELAARAFMGIFFVRTMGFIAVCFSNPAAWIAANILLIPVYLYVIKDLKAQLAQPEKHS
jgi:putative MATE family efflux protein